MRDGGCACDVRLRACGCDCDRVMFGVCVVVFVLV